MITKAKNIVLHLTILLISCSNQEKQDSESDLLHEAITSITENQTLFNNKVIIELDLSPLYANTKYSRTMSLPRGFFKHLTNAELLAPIDTIYLSSQIDTTRVGRLYPEKLNRPTISKDEIKLLFKEGFSGGWDKYKAKYGDTCILRVSSPIFNQDKTVLVFATILSCYKNIHGEATRFALKKKSGKWIILYTT